MQRCSPRRGFTLVELVIVVGIIGILASIAIPSFSFHRYKAKKSEAYSLIGAIHVGQETFGAEFDAYADITVPNPAMIAGFERTDWVDIPCPAACQKGNAAACTTFMCIAFTAGTTVYFQYVSPALGGGGGGVQREHAIGALGDLDGDGNPSGLSYQTANRAGPPIGVITDGISGCLPGIPSGAVMDCRPLDF